MQKSQKNPSKISLSLNIQKSQKQNNILNLIEHDKIMNLLIDNFLKIPENFSFFQQIMTEAFCNLIKSNNETFERIFDK